MLCYVVECYVVAGVECYVVGVVAIMLQPLFTSDMGHLFALLIQGLAEALWHFCDWMVLRWGRTVPSQV